MKSSNQMLGILTRETDFFGEARTYTKKERKTCVRLVQVRRCREANKTRWFHDRKEIRCNKQMVV